MSRNFLVAVVALLALCGLSSSAWGQALPGDLLVAEFGSDTVVEVSAGGDFSAAPPFATGLSGPTHLCVGPGGDVFVTEFSSGEVTIITAGGAAPAAFATGLGGPIALSCSGSEVLVSEFFDKEVTDITAGGSFAGAGAFATGLGTPIDLYRDSGGTLWVADRDGRVLDISAGGDFTLAPGFATSAAGSLFGLGEDDADLLVAQNDPSDPNAPDDRAVIAFTAGGDLGLLARTPVTAPEDILNVPGLGLFVSEVDGNSGRIYEISGGYAVGAPFATGIAGGAGFAGMVYIDGCPDGIVQGAEECDDDNATDGDGCSALCVVEFCGDGMIDAGLGEQCDDGNTISEDGCSAACVNELCGDGILHESLGEVCDDGNVLDGDGCAADCMRATFCEPAPDPACAVAGKAVFDIDERKPGKEKLKLALTKLATETLPADLGDPTGSTSYEICVYDEVGGLVEGFLVDRAGETCGDKGKDCWKAISRGFKFKDVAASSAGIRSITAKSGAEGKGQVKAAGKNNVAKGQAALPTGLAAALFLSPQVEVQVVTSDAQCFGATLSTSRADGSRYKAKK